MMPVAYDVNDMSKDQIDELFVYNGIELIDKTTRKGHRYLNAQGKPMYHLRGRYLALLNSLPKQLELQWHSVMMVSGCRCTAVVELWHDWPKQYLRSQGGVLRCIDICEYMSGTKLDVKFSDYSGLVVVGSNKLRVGVCLDKTTSIVHSFACVNYTKDESMVNQESVNMAWRQLKTNAFSECP